MREQIGKNYYLAVVRDGKVVANFYTNSLVVIAELKDRYKADDIEVFDIKKYGHSFGPAPVIKVEGGYIKGIRCIETGAIWRSAKECVKEMGMPLKTLYTAIRRGSRIFGRHYEYVEKKDGNDK